MSFFVMTYILGEVWQVMRIYSEAFGGLTAWVEDIGSKCVVHFTTFCCVVSS